MKPDLQIGLTASQVWREIKPHVHSYIRTILYALLTILGLAYLDIIHSNMLTRLSVAEQDLAYIQGAAKPLVQVNDGGYVSVIARRDEDE